MSAKSNLDASIASHVFSWRFNHGSATGEFPGSSCDLKRQAFDMNLTAVGVDLGWGNICQIHVGWSG
ncbi:MAG: hypothetical protein HKM03_08780 [Steroidobacteraceae bacterium]|nr:hypothetical protein [Steroidobacteraceae bacterium]